MTILTEKRCAPCEGGTQPLQGQQITDLIAQLDKHWENMNDDKIAGTFKFKNYYQTQAFVNAVAYIAHREDHHPDITFGYNQCRIELTTHAIGGLSENDFICAAKINSLLD